MTNRIICAHWSMFPEDDWPWQNFTAEEMAERESEALSIDPAFMELLQSLRSKLGVALPVTSGFRTTIRNKLIGGGPAHPLGKAADIRIFNPNAFRLVEMAAKLGFTGIGVKQKGPFGARFIHLDTLADGEGGAPRPAIWSY